MADDKKPVQPATAALAEAENQRRLEARLATSARLRARMAPKQEEERQIREESDAYLREMGVEPFNEKYRTVREQDVTEQIPYTPRSETPSAPPTATAPMASGSLAPAPSVLPLPSASPVLRTPEMIGQPEAQHLLPTPPKPPSETNVSTLPEGPTPGAGALASFAEQGGFDAVAVKPEDLTMASRQERLKSVLKNRNRWLADQIKRDVGDRDAATLAPEKTMAHEGASAANPWPESRAVSLPTGAKEVSDTSGLPMVVRTVVPFEKAHALTRMQRAGDYLGRSATEGTTGRLDTSAKAQNFPEYAIEYKGLQEHAARAAMPAPMATARADRPAFARASREAAAAAYIPRALAVRDQLAPMVKAQFERRGLVTANKGGRVAEEANTSPPIPRMAQGTWGGVANNILANNLNLAIDEYNLHHGLVTQRGIGQAKTTFAENTGDVLGAAGRVLNASSRKDDPQMKVATQALVNGDAKTFFQAVAGETVEKIIPDLWTLAGGATGISTIAVPLKRLLVPNTDTGTRHLSTEAQQQALDDFSIALQGATGQDVSPQISMMLDPVTGNIAIDKRTSVQNLMIKFADEERAADPSLDWNTALVRASARADQVFADALPSALGLTVVDTDPNATVDDLIAALPDFAEGTPWWAYNVKLDEKISGSTYAENQAWAADIANSHGLPRYVGTGLFDLLHANPKLARPIMASLLPPSSKSTTGYVDTTDLEYYGGVGAHLVWFDRAMSPFTNTYAAAVKGMDPFSAKGLRYIRGGGSVVDIAPQMGSLMLMGAQGATHNRQAAWQGRSAPFIAADIFSGGLLGNIVGPVEGYEDYPYWYPDPDDPKVQLVGMGASMALAFSEPDPLTLLGGGMHHLGGGAFWAGSKMFGKEGATLGDLVGSVQRVYAIDTSLKRGVKARELAQQIESGATSVDDIEKLLKTVETDLSPEDAQVLQVVINAKLGNPVNGDLRGVMKRLASETDEAAAALIEARKQVAKHRGTADEALAIAREKQANERMAAARLQAMEWRTVQAEAKLDAMRGKGEPVIALGDTDTTPHRASVRTKPPKAMPQRIITAAKEHREAVKAVQEDVGKLQQIFETPEVEAAYRDWDAVAAQHEQAQGAVRLAEKHKETQITAASEELEAARTRLDELTRSLQETAATKAGLKTNPMSALEIAIKRRTELHGELTLLRNEAMTVAKDSPEAAELARKMEATGGRLASVDRHLAKLSADMDAKGYRQILQNAVLQDPRIADAEQDLRNAQQRYKQIQNAMQFRLNEAKREAEQAAKALDRSKELVGKHKPRIEKIEARIAANKKRAAATLADAQMAGQWEKVNSARRETLRAEAEWKRALNETRREAEELTEPGQMRAGDHPKTYAKMRERVVKAVRGEVIDPTDADAINKPTTGLLRKQFLASFKERLPQAVSEALREHAAAYDAYAQAWKDRMWTQTSAISWGTFTKAIDANNVELDVGKFVKELRARYGSAVLDAYIADGQANPLLVDLLSKDAPAKLVLPAAPRVKSTVDVSLRGVQDIVARLDTFAAWQRAEPYMPVKAVINVANSPQLSRRMLAGIATRMLEMPEDSAMGTLLAGLTRKISPAMFRRRFADPSKYGVANEQVYKVVRGAIDRMNGLVDELAHVIAYVDPKTEEDGADLIHRYIDDTTPIAYQYEYLGTHRHNVPLGPPRVTRMNVGSESLWLQGRRAMLAKFAELEGAEGAVKDESLSAKGIDAFEALTRVWLGNNVSDISVYGAELRAGTRQNLEAATTFGDFMTRQRKMLESTAFAKLGVTVDARVDRVYYLAGQAVIQASSIDDMTRNAARILGPQITPERARAANVLMMGGAKDLAHFSIASPMGRTNTRGIIGTTQDAINTWVQLGVPWLAREHTVKPGVSKGVELVASSMDELNRPLYMPNHIIDALQQELNDLVKITGRMNDQGSAAEPLGMWALRKYGSLMRADMTVGVMFPRLGYWMNNLAGGDPSQMAQEVGAAQALRRSVKNAWVNLPWIGRALQDAGGKMAQVNNWGDTPILGTIMGTLFDPKLSAVLAGDDVYFTARSGHVFHSNDVYRLAVQQSVLETGPGVELADAIDRALTQRRSPPGLWGRLQNAYGMHREEVTSHANQVQQRQRLGLFLEELLKHGDADRAGDTTRRALYDFKHGFAQWEIDYVANLIPFYRFNRLMLRQIGEALLEPLIAPDIGRALAGDTQIARLRNQTTLLRGMPRWSQQFWTEEEDQDNAALSTLMFPEWSRGARIKAGIPLDAFVDTSDHPWLRDYARERKQTGDALAIIGPPMTGPDGLAFLGMLGDFALAPAVAIQMGTLASVTGEPARFRTPQAVYERMALDMNEKVYFGPTQGLTEDVIKKTFPGGEEPITGTKIRVKPGHEAIFNTLGAVAPSLQPDEEGRVPAWAKLVLDAVPVAGSTVPQYLNALLDHPEGALTSGDMRVLTASWAQLAGRLGGVNSYVIGEDDTLKSIQRPVKNNLKADLPPKDKRR